MKYLIGKRWAIWLIGVIFAFLFFIQSSLSGISLTGIFLGAYYLIPILLFAFLNKIFEKRRKTQNPNQNIKDYNIIDFCLVIIIIIFEILTIGGIIYCVAQYFAFIR